MDTAVCISGKHDLEEIKGILQAGGSENNPTDQYKKENKSVCRKFR